jgi:NAD(P)-dependent dehydrogenase (short-subunit alcohol dehydrogenase family)
MEGQTVATIPIGRMVEPEDIADLIVSLASHGASAIACQTIAVDGGAGRGVYCQ